MKFLYFSAIVACATLGFFGALHFMGRENFSPHRYAGVGFYIYGKGGNTNHLSNGWAAPEDWGVWSVGKRAELEIDLETPLITDIRLTVNANLLHPTQVIDVIVNGKKIGQWTFKKGSRRKSLEIDRQLVENRDLLKIVFLIQLPMSPKELGISSDGRKLGIGLKEITLESAL